MSQQRLTKSQIFSAVAEVDDPLQRARLLTELCGNNLELKLEIQGLLAGEQQLGSFLDLSAAELQRKQAEPDQTAVWHGGLSEQADNTGKVIGPYKLVQTIGEGGMGTVWLAEQEIPVRRQVALKVIKAGVGSREIIIRFEAERQALALMNHPNIARILDAGTTDQGQPYFAMELVQGLPLTKYCDQNRLGISDRLKLFTDVCSGVQHAHQKGVIHRDLKPGNILVTEVDGKPVPKVIDFGLAKALESTQRLTDQSMFTGIGQILGTLKYMSPEQASLDLVDIDTRTDIYALGVILYELLTGSTPLDDESVRGQAILKVLGLIREQEPVKPSRRLQDTGEKLSSITNLRRTDSSSLNRILVGDLDWVVVKALEKDRSRRYESASGLAADIQRFLNNEPVVARPPSVNYRIQKFVTKNRGLVTAGAAVTTSLLIGLVAFAWQAQVARYQRNLANSSQQAEAKQRKAAEEQRDRAVKAEADVQSRADELQKVSDFQARMLKQTDSANAGVQLMKNIRNKFAVALKRAEPPVPEDERTRRAAIFEAELLQVNATDTARELIDCTILQPAVKAIDEQFRDQPKVDAQLRQTLATLYRELGLFEAALPLQEDALKTRRRELGEEHRDTLSSIDELATLLLKQGKLVEAEQYFREGLKKSIRVMGDDDPATLTIISGLATSLLSQNKKEEAGRYYLQLLETSRRVLGEDHPNTLRAIEGFGGLLFEQGNVVEAEKHLREALEKHRLVLGEDHPDTLIAINNLGGVLHSQGKLADAEPYFREALEKVRKLRGEEHPETLRSVAWYGRLLYSQGKLAEAEQYWREVVEKQRRVLGEGHLFTLRSTNQLANVLRGQDKLAEAESYFRMAMESFRRVWGEEHPETLIQINSLGNMLHAQGRLAEAEPYIREELEIRRRVFGEDHPETLTSMNNLASLYWAKKQFDKSVPLFESLLYRSEAKLGRQHLDTLLIAANLGVNYKDSGRLDEGIELLDEVYQSSRKLPDFSWVSDQLIDSYAKAGKNDKATKMIQDQLAEMRATLSTGSPQLAGALAQFCMTLIELKSYADAESLLRECLDIRKQLEPEDWRTFNTMSMLGASLLGQEKYADAEPLLREGYDGMQQRQQSIPPQGQDRIPQALQRLITLYTNTEKPEEAILWQKRLDEFNALIPSSKTVK